jgi:hypothetical protein
MQKTLIIIDLDDIASTDVPAIKEIEKREQYAIIFLSSLHEDEKDKIDTVLIRYGINCRRLIMKSNYHADSDKGWWKMHMIHIQSQRWRESIIYISQSSQSVEKEKIWNVKCFNKISEWCIAAQNS